MLRLNRSPLLLLLIAACAPLFAQEEPNVRTHSSAGTFSSAPRTNFQTDLFTGSFTNEVPIQLPPARQKSEPSVALTYNSARGNGWIGVGWTLDPGYIQRRIDNGVPISWSNPGASPDLSYDDTKGFEFFFQGAASKLVPTGNPNEYAAEIESGFLRFTFVDPHWQVSDRDGNTFFFGETTDSRIESLRPGWPTATGSSTFRWSISRAQDANGNTSSFQYTIDDFSDVPGKVAHQQYLQEIRYNGHSSGISETHSVAFILEDRPVDAPFDFLAGHRVETRKRLSQIVVTVSGLMVRSYELRYHDSPSTGRSLLEEVQEFGAQGSALPAMRFSYQEQEFGDANTGAFGPSTAWGGTLANQGQSGQYWGSVGAFGLNDHVTHLGFFDVDRDGFPDRIMPKLPSSSSNPRYVVQFNSESGFQGGAVDLGLFDNSEFGNYAGRSVRFTGLSGSNSHHNVLLVDLDGDGAFDRVSREQSGSLQLNVQCSDHGLEFPDPPMAFAIDTQGSTSVVWKSPEGVENQRTVTTLLDVNGDARPDRLMRVRTGPFDHYKIQYNSGNSFDPVRSWPILNQGNQDSGWSSLFFSANEDLVVGQFDMNGDGLPDRVMRERTGNECGSSAFDHFVIQFNNGSGYENSLECWPISSQGQTSSDWNSPFGGYKQNIGSSNDPIFVWPSLTILRDCNGDGLPDRIMKTAGSSHDRFVVQINHGSGFLAPVNLWFDPNFSSQGSTSVQGNSPVSLGGFEAIQTITDMMDINGDGLLDRVMRKAATPYNQQFVELSQGPFPDLLCTVENGVGAKTEVQYVPSTKYDNRDIEWSGSPWSAGAKSLLGQVIHTVGSVTVEDGLTPPAVTSYSYKNGYFDAPTREFRGFNLAIETDPLGAETRTYFHQGGGVDKSASGEFDDTSSVAKKGIPYRTETWGSDGLLYQETFHKVEEIPLGPGRCFPYVAQTVTREYEGLPLARARATAQQFEYDPASATLTRSTHWGEIDAASFVPLTHAFSDVLPGGADDAFHKHYTYYPALANPEIQFKMKDEATTLDSAGLMVIRKSHYFYAGGTGNLVSLSRWLDTLGPNPDNSAHWVTEQRTYDPLTGNLTKVTDPSGNATSYAYDPVFQIFRETITVDPSGLALATIQTHDARSGELLWSTEASGLQMEQQYDEHFRPTNRFHHLPGGSTIWQERLAYNLGGVSGGQSQNWVHRQVNDGVDAGNGLETYRYRDGLGRVVQSRTEAEPNPQGNYRVTDTVYDRRGSVMTRTRSYFSTGPGYTPYQVANPATNTLFDPIGRPVEMQPPQGDTQSPLASEFIDYFNPTTQDPWVLVRTDSLGKIVKSSQDAFGRIVALEEVTNAGSLISRITYDRIGNRTAYVDSAVPGNVTSSVYDTLDRRTQLTDPDTGISTHTYDGAGRIKSETDAKGQRIEFDYDGIGRTLQRRIYDTQMVETERNDYTYDQPAGSAFTVFPGQLGMVTDNEGWVKFSYDVQGRILKKTRRLTKTGKNYAFRYEYDDAGSLTKMTYPKNVASIRYSYDTGGNLTRIESLSGLSPAEVFFQSTGYDELGQLEGKVYGNGVETALSYYPNSRRLMNIHAFKGATVHQDLSYAYDAANNVASIVDAVDPTGYASGTVTGLAYDDLHRLESYTRQTDAGRLTVNFAYDSVGNMTLNEDFGPGTYSYPPSGSPRPHAVLSANGHTYSYDPNGNMITRGPAGGVQTLSYDPLNRLESVSSASATVTFGYDFSDARLWRQKGAALSLWIDELYEERGGKTYCHVIADGRRICTFEPLKLRLLTTPTVSVPTPAPTPIPIPAGGGGGGIAIGGTMVRVAQRIPLGNKLYYYHSDQLSSTKLITNRNGNVIEHLQNSAYGEEVYELASNGFDPSNRYTDQVADLDTGLTYYRSRYYDPQLGRFTQADTIVPGPFNPQAYNRYSYVLNNPFKYNDPTGHSAEGFFDGFFFVLSLPGKLLNSLGTLLNQSGIPVLKQLGKSIADVSAVLLGPVELLRGVVAGSKEQLIAGAKDFALGVASIVGAGLFFESTATPGKDGAAATGSLSLPKSVDDKIKEAKKELGNDQLKSDRSRGMKKWHTLSNGYAVSDVSLTEIPWIILGGIVHEIEPGAVSAEINDQGLGSWLIDTPGDLIANTFGQLGGLLLPRSWLRSYAIGVGSIIPGPYDPFEADGF